MIFIASKSVLQDTNSSIMTSALFVILHVKLAMGLLRIIVRNAKMDMSKLRIDVIFVIPVAKLVMELVKKIA